jgi:hypothetical protein
MNVGKRSIGLDRCGDCRNFRLDTGGVPRRSMVIKAERQATTRINDGFGVEVDAIHGNNLDKTNPYRPKAFQKP